MRADSMAGRIIGAIARTPEPVAKPNRHGLPRDSTAGRIVGALARTPGQQEIQGPAASDNTPSGGHVTSPGASHQDSTQIARAPGKHKEVGSSPAREREHAPNPAPNLARDLIELRITARDLMRALSAAFDLNHKLSEETGIIFNIEVVTADAKLLAQALDTVHSLAKALDEAGTEEFRRVSPASDSFDLAETIAVAQKVRRIRDGISTLGRVINGVGLPSTPGDVARDWNLPETLDRLSLTFTSITELVRHSEVNDPLASSGFSHIADHAETLTSTANELREVARSAADLSRELVRASKIAREVSAAQLDIASIPADLLDAADKLAQEFNVRELIEAQTAVHAMSELLRTIDEIRGYSVAVSKAGNLNEALNARGVIGRLNRFEMIFNYARVARNVDVRSSRDNLSRAIWQINRLATGHIDASAADLRQLKVRDLDVLDGITWTRETIWPPSIRSEVRARSGEIEPGVYRVGDGNDRDPADLAISS